MTTTLVVPRRGEQSGGLFDRAHAKHDAIKTADWVIDLGPEGGVKGGTIVAEGTPEQVATAAGSYTGAYLAPLLARAGKGAVAAERVAAE